MKRATVGMALVAAASLGLAACGGAHEDEHVRTEEVTHASKPDDEAGESTKPEEAGEDEPEDVEDEPQEGGGTEEPASSAHTVEDTETFTTQYTATEFQIDDSGWLIDESTDDGVESLTYSATFVDGSGSEVLGMILPDENDGLSAYDLIVFAGFDDGNYILLEEDVFPGDAGGRYVLVDAAQEDVYLVFAAPDNAGVMWVIRGNEVEHVESVFGDFVANW